MIGFERHGSVGFLWSSVRPGSPKIQPLPNRTSGGAFNARSGTSPCFYDWPDVVCDVCLEDESELEGACDEDDVPELSACLVGCSVFWPFDFSEPFSDPLSADAFSEASPDFSAVPSVDSGFNLLE